ncbi:hypothetical protein D3C73_1579010 [compost metagenome]
MPLPRIARRVSTSAILTFNTGNNPWTRFVTVGEVLRTAKAGLTPAPRVIVIAAVVE